MYPLATIAVAGVSLILSSFFAFRSLSRSASADWVEQLEKRIELCEQDRAELHKENDALRSSQATLRSENWDLMRRILKLEGGS